MMPFFFKSTYLSPSLSATFLFSFIDDAFSLSLSLSWSFSFTPLLFCLLQTPVASLYIPTQAHQLCLLLGTSITSLSLLFMVWTTSYGWMNLIFQIYQKITSFSPHTERKSWFMRWLSKPFKGALSNREQIGGTHHPTHFIGDESMVLRAPVRSLVNLVFFYFIVVYIDRKHIKKTLCEC